MRSNPEHPLQPAPPADGAWSADWAVLDTAAATDAELDPALLRELGVVGRIAEAHRAAAFDGADSDGGQERRWGPLVIKERLGAGSFAEVYRAHDPRLQRDVALKIYRDACFGGASLASLFAEGRLLARVRHPNVVTLHGVEQHGNEVGLWLELIDGRTLAEEVRSAGFLGFRESALVGQDVCRALAAVHQAGLVHGDIKAQNVMRERGGRIVVMDFGVGRDLRGEVPRAVTAEVGTPLYMAPELFDGAPATVSSDIYSVGVLLFFLVTGTYPVIATDRAGLERAHRSGVRRLLRDLRSDLPDSFVEIVERACAGDPRKRYATVGAMQSALAAVVGISPWNLTTTALTGGRATTAYLPPSSPTVQNVAVSDAEVIVRLLQRYWAATVAVAALLVLALLVAGGGRSRRSELGISVGSDAFPDLQIRPLTLTGDATSGAISPDGKFVAYVRKNAGIWVRQTSTENAVQIVPFVQDRSYSGVTITPDGNSVDFMVGEGPHRDLWRVPLLGGTPLLLVRDVWSAPGWSPDGRRMAFLRTKGRADETSVVTADEDGANERTLLTRHPPFDFLNIGSAGTPNRPAWSPDGRQLMLIAASDVPLTAIVIVDSSNGREVRTLPIRDGLALEAAWLDDTRILLNSSTGFNSLPGLWSIDLATAKWTPVTREFTQFHRLSLASNRAMGVAIKTSKRSGLWLGSAFGDSGRIVLPETGAAAGHPVVDNAGGIVYVAYTGNGDSTLYRLAPNASKPTPLGEGSTYGAGGSATDAAGRFVVFTSTPEGPLYRINPDGSGLTTLVGRDAKGPAISIDGTTVIFSPFRRPGLYSVPLIGGPVRELSKVLVTSSLAISPDGGRLLFTSSKPGVCTLCDLPDCTNPRQLQLRSWRWAPDGQGVAYINHQDHMNLWEQPLDGGAPRPLTRFPDAQVLDFAWSPDGKRLVLARGRRSDDIVLLTGLR